MYNNITEDMLLELKHELTKLGYSVRTINKNFFVVEQGQHKTILSFDEANNLYMGNLNHPVILSDYVYISSLNRWEKFKITS